MKDSRRAAIGQMYQLERFRGFKVENALEQGVRLSWPTT